MSCLPILQIPPASTNSCIVQGDTIPEVLISAPEFPDLTTSTIKMQLYSGNKKVLDIQNGSGITVDSSTQFTIDEIPGSENNFPEGKIEGDVEITDSNGFVKTYFRIAYIISKQFTK